jgi:hypothetical protein
MADQYTPEQIQAIFEEYNNAIKSGTPVTSELAARMKDATVGIKGYTEQLNKSLKSLGSSILGTAKALKDGQQGASVFNDGIESAADAVEAFTSKFGILGRILGTLITAGAKYAVEVNKQSDALFKTYKDISSSGLADAGGMRNIFDNMQKFGYGIEQLGDMTALLKENSKALAAFGGTAATGTRAFADAASEIQRSEVGKSLQMLGKTPDDINKGMALFVKQQQQSGMASSAINKDLAQQSAAYIKNLDTLSKLTGDDASRLQEKLDAAMAEDAFNQTIYELKKKAAAGDAEAGRLATEYENAARRLTGEALKEFQQGVGGDISAMGKTLMASSDAVGMIGKASFTASGYIDSLSKGVTKQRDTMGGLFKLNAGKDFMFSAKEMSEIQSRYADTTAQNQEEMAKAQQELQQKGLDPATKAQVEMRIEQMKTRDEFQSLINKGINPVTKGMAKLAGGIESVTDKLPGTEGSTGKQIGGGESSGGWWKNIFGGGGGATGTTAQILETIKNRESGGNYQAQAKGSTASGAYQFIDSTWQSLTKKAGIGTEYKSAKLAPKEIQDAIAKTYVDDILKQSGGDVSKVPLAWYTGNIQGKMSAQALAANNGLTAETYQQKWMTDFNKMGSGTNMSGPTGRYASTTTDINPASKLPTASNAQASASPAQEEQPAWATSLNAALEKQNRLLADVSDNTKKTATYAAVN